jgi:Ala-tRNA(Pro) deacylase
MQPPAPPLAPRAKPRLFAPVPASPDDLFALLGRLGIVTSTVEHPPAFTVDQWRELRGTIPGGHTKNLFLVDRKDRLFLVVAEETAVIELSRLHARIGASGRLSFGKPEVLRATLGVEPGSVTPFAAINETARVVTIVVDAALMRHEELNFHPLINTRTTRIRREDLLRFLAATGHAPRILAVSVPTAEAADRA